MTTVEKIHQEIDTAEDRLLTEAKRIIALNTDTGDKAERLERIGFVNSELVVKNKGKKQAFVKNKEQAQLIEYYKQNYPFQKFLTEQELDRICEKYNLVYAPILNYKKDVPEKNLSDIERSPELRNLDFAKDLIYTVRTPERFAGGGKYFLSPTSKWQFLLPKKIEGQFNSKFSLDEHLNKVYKTGITYLTKEIETVTEIRQGLFIAAPKSHFNLSGLKKAGIGFFGFTVMPEPKDPIVFRYVRGGIQVITKWGLEAEDKDLVNEKMN